MKKQNWENYQTSGTHVLINGGPRFTAPWYRREMSRKTCLRCSDAACPSWRHLQQPPLKKLGEWVEARMKMGRSSPSRNSIKQLGREIWDLLLVLRRRLEPCRYYVFVWWWNLEDGVLVAMRKRSICQAINAQASSLTKTLPSLSSHLLLS